MILYKRPAFVRLKRKENQYGVKFRKATLSHERNLTSTIQIVHSLQKGHKAGPGWPTNSLQEISLHQAVLTLSQWSHVSCLWLVDNIDWQLQLQLQ